LVVVVKLFGCFHVVLLFSKSFHFWASFIMICNFLKIPSVFRVKGCYRFDENECYTVLFQRKNSHGVKYLELLMHELSPPKTYRNEMIQGPYAHLGSKCWDMGIVA
jgi:hypothetical protein